VGGEERQHPLVVEDLDPPELGAGEQDADLAVVAADRVEPAARARLRGDAAADVQRAAALDEIADRVGEATCESIQDSDRGVGRNPAALSVRGSYSGRYSAFMNATRSASSASVKSKPRAAS
jgi:hypothetical protein